MIITFSLLMLPSLGGSIHSDRNASSVILHDQQVINGVEVSTLQAKKVDDLMQWFEKHHYRVPLSMKNTLADLLAENWFINACRLENVQGSKTSPKCLQLTFKAATPVYPMRLTGVEAATPLKLRLFVAGPGNARVEGLKLLAASPAKEEEMTPALQQLIKPGMQVSALEGTVSVESMQKDMPVNFEKAEQKFLVLPNQSKTAYLLALCVIWAITLLFPFRKKPRQFKQIALGATIAAAGIITYFNIPRYKDGKLPRSFKHKYQTRQTRWEISKAFDENPPRSLQQAQAIAAAHIKKLESENPDTVYASYSLKEDKENTLILTITPKKNILGYELQSITKKIELSAVE